DDVETPHPDQRAGALLRGDLHGVTEGVARLSQRHFPERRRQIELRRIRSVDAAAKFRRHGYSRNLEPTGPYILIATIIACPRCWPDPSRGGLSGPRLEDE